jgi:hypothetical protein
MWLAEKGGRRGEDEAGSTSLQIARLMLVIIERASSSSSLHGAAAGRESCLIRLHQIAVGASCLVCLAFLHYLNLNIDVDINMLHVKCGLAYIAPHRKDFRAFLDSRFRVTHPFAAKAVMLLSSLEWLSESGSG